MKRIFLTLISGVLLLTGCGVAQTGQPTATVGIAATPIATLVATTTTTTEVMPTPTCTVVVPGMPDGLCMGGEGDQTVTPAPPARVVILGFSVWQDFMPGIPSGGPPLHASISLSIDWPNKIVPATSSGTIRVLRASGDELISADLLLSQAVDDLGLMQPGPQQVTFSIAPVQVGKTLVEGEALHGTATIMLEGKAFTVDLPETQLLFTH